MDAIWTEYQSKSFPRMRSLLNRAVGREISVDIDWDSLGDGSRDLTERLDYDLEMLARGIEGTDRHNPLASKSDAIDYSALSAGIERIAIRWVAGIADCKLCVENGTLQVHYSPHGAFSSVEVEALLLDRNRSEFDQFVTKAPPNLSAALEDVRNHRLPAVFQAIKKALGRPLKIEIDWSSLGHGYEAPPRLLYLLRETATALRGLADNRPALTVGPEYLHERERRKAAARSDGVRKGIVALAVHGALTTASAPVELDKGVVRLAVYIDPTTSSQGRLRPDYDLRVIPACKAAGIQQVLSDALNLRVQPLVEQLTREDLPKLQPYMARILEEAITSARGLKVPERVALRRLAEEGPKVFVDLDSFIHAGDSDTAIAALKTLETGHYNYNSDAGPFAGGFFNSLTQALTDTEFLTAFLNHVHEIWLIRVASPRQKELGMAKGAIILRQCAGVDDGMLENDLSGPLKAIVAMLESGAVNAAAKQADPPVDESALEEQFAQLGAQLKSFLGQQIAFEFDPAICNTPAQASELSQRGILPVLGALKLLLEKPEYAEDLTGALQRLRILKNVVVQARVEKRELILDVNPIDGPTGWPNSKLIAAALNDGLGLQARLGIRERERESREWWQTMLRERFDREVPLLIDWESFLNHPKEGGNRFYPFYLEESGIRSLLYALTGYMDEDPDFKTRARKAIHEIKISAAAESDGAELTLSRQLLHYRCYADMSRQGYFRTERLQERLHSLAYPKAGR